MPVPGNQPELDSGNNPYLTIRANGSFHVSTPKQEEVECLSLGTFFPERKYISMLEMLATVDHATNFLDEFEHWQSQVPASPASQEDPVCRHHRLWL
jgi:hypothetical protein